MHARVKPASRVISCFAGLFSMPAWSSGGFLHDVPSFASILNSRRPPSLLFSVGLGGRTARWRDGQGSRPSLGTGTRPHRSCARSGVGEPPSRPFPKPSQWVFGSMREQPADIGVDPKGILHPEVFDLAIRAQPNICKKNRNASHSGWRRASDQFVVVFF